MRVTKQTLDETYKITEDAIKITTKTANCPQHGNGSVLWHESAGYYCAECRPGLLPLVGGSTRTGPSICGNGDEDPEEDALDHAENLHAAKGEGVAVLIALAVVGVVGGAIGGGVIVGLLYWLTR